MGDREIQGDVYQMWQSENVTAEQKVSAQFSGLLAAGELNPCAAQSSDDTQSPVPSARVPQLEGWTPWALGGVLLLGLAGVFAWVWRAPMAQTGGEKALLRRQRTEPLQRIAKLDDLHAVGELSDAHWQQQRARLKAELLTVALQLTE